METIETQTTSQISFDKYEVIGEIYRVKKNLENMCYMEFGVNTKYVFWLP